MERRRVDEIDAQLDRTPQNFLRVLAIRRPTPDPSRQPHRRRVIARKLCCLYQLSPVAPKIDSKGRSGSR